MPAQVSLLCQTDQRRLRYAEMIACGELVASQQREVVAAVVMAGGDPTRGQALLAEIERTPHYASCMS